MSFCCGIEQQGIDYLLYCIELYRSWTPLHTEGKFELIVFETVNPLANYGLLLWFLWLAGQFFFLKPLWLKFLRWLLTYVILWPTYTTAGVFLFQFDHKVTVVWFIEFILISGQCFGLDPDIVKGVARYRWSETGKERAHYLWIEHKALMMRPWFCFVPYGYEKKSRIHTREMRI